MSAGGGSTAPPRHNQTGVPYNHQYHNSGSYNIPPQHTWPQGAATGRALPPPGPVIGASNPSSGTDGRGDPSTAQVMQQNWNPSIGNRSHSSQRRMHSPGNSSVSSFARTMSPDALSTYSAASGHNGSSSTHTGSSSHSSSENHTVGGPRGHERFEQRYMYIYNAVAGGVPVQFILTVEAAPLSIDESIITLTFKAGGIEQSIGGKEYMRLNVEPHTLHFHVFIFPKPSLPANCLFCVRVWLEAQQVQHRIFSDESLWVGKDPPFASIQQVALTQQGPPTIPSTNRNEPDVIRKTYKGYVGRAPCDFVVIIKSINIAGSVWGISVEYQAGGISRLLFEQIKVRLHCRLEDIRFIIYTVPIDSSIPYSNHRVRVWIKGLDGAHIRLFKSDEFRLGSQLAFEPLTHGPGHVVFATRDRSTPTIALHSSLLLSDSPKPSPSENRELSSTPGSGTVESIPDRELRAEAEYEQRRIGISVGIGGGARGSVSGGNLPFDESLPSYNAALGVGI
ncbi:hypothetical protein FRC14_007928 [Serendipita sp. 396]|nr:hypothetical protein FRC14_007928 [Serendipita sp. 396]